MRAEQREAEFSALLQQRGEELQCLRNSQLSPSFNVALGDAGPRDVLAAVSVVPADTQAELGYDALAEFAGSRNTRVELVWNYKLKPDTFDGTVPLREFFSQFNLIARAN